MILKLIDIKTSFGNAILNVTHLMPTVCDLKQAYRMLSLWKQQKDDTTTVENKPTGCFSHKHKSNRVIVIKPKPNKGKARK